MTLIALVCGFVTHFNLVDILNPLDGFKLLKCYLASKHPSSRLRYVPAILPLLKCLGSFLNLEMTCHDLASQIISRSQLQQNIAIGLSLAYCPSVSIHTHINQPSIIQPNRTISPSHTMDNYDNTFDNTDSVHFTSQALFDRTSRYQNSYTLPFRPREARHRISSAGSAFKESTNHIADLAQELKIQHDERTFSMPRRERGRYWTWAMFPGARLGLPAQKDIDNARSIFNASLTSQVEAIDATEYFSRNGPTLTVEDMRVHMELFLEIYMKMLHEGDKYGSTFLC